MQKRSEAVGIVLAAAAIFQGKSIRRRMVEDIAKDILSYFLRNPQAADDLEGVARWRLLNHTVHRDVEETSQALDWLVRQGLLGRVSRTGSGAIFRLRPEQRAAAEAFLAESEDERSQGPDA
jgi:hypothetical protein